MVKSTRIEYEQRVQAVLRLLVANAQFSDIRQHSQQQGWNVSDRQLRRYIDEAHSELAEMSQRNRKQQYGRHVMQRQMLFTQALKKGDLRTALRAAQDEAKLQNVYSDGKPVTPQREHSGMPAGSSPLSCRERVVQMLDADSRDDQQQIRLLDQVAPRMSYAFPDTRIPLLGIHLMCLIYVNEQLEAAGMVLHAFWCGTMIDPDHDEYWNSMANCSAYRFRIGEQAWREFTEEFNIDGHELVQQNHVGWLLEFSADNICRLAPSEEELRLVLDDDEVELLTAEDLAESWREMFCKFCPE